MLVGDRSKDAVRRRSATASFSASSTNRSRNSVYRVSSITQRVRGVHQREGRPVAARRDEVCEKATAPQAGRTKERSGSSARSPPGFPSSRPRWIRASASTLRGAWAFRQPQMAPPRGRQCQQRAHRRRRKSVGRAASDIDFGDSKKVTEATRSAMPSVNSC